MAMHEIYEEEIWQVSCDVDSGDMEGKSITLVFKVGADEKYRQPVTVSGQKANYDYRTAKVPDDKPNYVLSCYAEYGSKTGNNAEKLPDECTVWPLQFKVIAKDEGGALVQGFAFTAKHGANDLTPPTTNNLGEALFNLKQEASAAVITATPPGEIVEEKRDAGTPRVANLKVKRKYVPEFVKPTPNPDGSAKKQFVNLDTTNKGVDGNGPEVEIEVGVKDEGAGKGKKDDVIYIQVKFGRESKRNNPLPELVGATERPSDKEHKGEVKLTSDNGTAKFTVKLGLAGSDTCEVRLSGVKDNFTGPKVPLLSFENWRELYYQLSVPEGASAPNLTRMTAALEKIKVVFTKYKDLEFTKDRGPAGGAISWYDGAWVGEAGKKFLNLGDYNKAWFHAKFVDDKTPIGVHAACCHTQYDANSPDCKRLVNLQGFDSAATFNWSDGNTIIGKNHWVGGGLFPKFLKDGSDAFAGGTWQAASAPDHGTMTKNDVWIREHPHVGWITVRLPAAAETFVKGAAGRKVDLTFWVRSALGPYLGESDGNQKWLQLIVLHQTVNPLNDVMSHELGHTLNQVTNVVASGLDAASHGREYTANGHQGSHCADGMTDANYAGGSGASGTNYNKNFKGKPECTCIMYGENGPGSTCTGSFCARCEPFLKAEAMTTLH